MHPDMPTPRDHIPSEVHTREEEKSLSDEQLFEAIKAGTITREQFLALRDKEHERLKHLEDLSIEDELTGLLNRRGFNKALQKAFARTARSHKPFTLIGCDIDYFKRANDTLPRGHLDGDEILKAYAEAMHESTRDVDDLARPGGDEFALILETDEKNAQMVAERIRLRVIEKIKERFPTIEWEQTSSMGITEYKEGDSPTDMAMRVEKALYAAKEGGRNQTVIYQQQKQDASTA